MSVFAKLIFDNFLPKSKVLSSSAKIIVIFPDKSFDNFFRYSCLVGTIYVQR